MKIKPLFIILCVIILVAQKLIFSDAVTVIADSYPLMIFVFPLIILTIPFDFDKPFLLITAFFIGLILDVFNDTLGVNAFSLVMLAYMRGYILQLIQPRIGYKPGSSSLKSYGFGWAIMYLLLSLFIFSFSFFMIDAFTFIYIKKVLFCAAISTMASFPFGILILLTLKAT
ncbi:MAG: hypothetical protein V3V00_11520 [Saprospiraceae bacterium]